MGHSGFLLTMPNVPMISMPCAEFHVCLFSSIRTWRNDSYFDHWKTCDPNPICSPCRDTDGVSSGIFGLYACVVVTHSLTTPGLMHSSFDDPYFGYLGIAKICTENVALKMILPGQISSSRVRHISVNPWQSPSPCLHVPGIANFTTKLGHNGLKSTHMSQRYNLCCKSP